jgi:hypothetical protein
MIDSPEKAGPLILVVPMSLSQKMPHVSQKGKHKGNDAPLRQRP